MLIGLKYQFWVFPKNNQRYAQGLLTPEKNICLSYVRNLYKHVWVKSENFACMSETVIYEILFWRLKFRVYNFHRSLGGSTAYIFYYNPLPEIPRAFLYILQSNNNWTFHQLSIFTFLLKF